MNTCKRVMIIIGIVLIVAMIAMMLIPWEKEHSRLEFEGLEGQFSLLERAHQKWFGERMALDDEVSWRVKCDWYLTMSLSADESEGWLESREQLNGDIMDLIVDKPFQSVFWIGESAFEDWVKLGDASSRAEILSRCKPLAPELETHVDKGFSAFKELCSREGLLDAKGGILPNKREIAELLHRHLWFEAMSGNFSMSRLSSPEEQQTFFRWQIESSTMPLMHKLARLEQAQKSGMDYDFDYARAVLLEANGMPEESCMALNDGLKTASNAFRRDRYQKSKKVLLQAHPNACANNHAADSRQQGD